jgi:hypothetical protein
MEFKVSLSHVSLYFNGIKLSEKNISVMLLIQDVSGSVLSPETHCNDFYRLLYGNAVIIAEIRTQVPQCVL